MKATREVRHWRKRAGNDKNSMKVKKLQRKHTGRIKNWN